MYARNIAGPLRSSLVDSPVVFLQGARQTGKSTLVGALGRPCYTLDDAMVFAAATADPEGFVCGLPDGAVIDEVQRVPRLAVALKASVDRDRRASRFLLTGSAGLAVLPALSDALVGRMDVLTLWPLSQGELRGVREGWIDRAFSGDWSCGDEDPLSRAQAVAAVIAGGYPEALSRPAPAARDRWFAAYALTLLQREVRELARIDDMGALTRLLALLAARSGQVQNVADLGRALAVPQTTLTRWMAMLEGTFLVRRIPAWTADLGRRLLKSPKVVLTDSGLAAHLMGADAARLDQQPALFGPLLEGFVSNELVRAASWSRTRPTLHHLRTADGVEVDLVLEDRAGRLVGVEIKATASVATSDFRGLRMLADCAGDRFVGGVVLHLGERAVPFGDRLHALPLGCLWSSQ